MKIKMETVIIRKTRKMHAVADFFKKENEFRNRRTSKFMLSSKVVTTK